MVQSVDLISVHPYVQFAWQDYRWMQGDYTGNLWSCTYSEHFHIPSNMQDGR